MASVLVGMSGGVDSSVAAAMLLEQGYEVVGGYMKNWTNEEGLPGDCPWEQDIRDAREVCEFLGIEFRILSLMDEYRDRVVDYLLSGYRDGITPNPDVMCNREMKFGIFREFAIAQGFDHVATGHYAQIRKNDDETFDIYRGAKGKDQTYFLALLEQEQFRQALFPIGHLPKPEVRKEAERYGVPVANKKDSQGICFIGDIKMSDFLGHYIDTDPGDIITLDGKKVGAHQGLHLHTLGQRKGLGVPSNTYGKAYVVVEKRPATNEVVVAFDEPDTPGLYATRCRVGSISVTNRDLAEVAGESEVLVQPRYRCDASPVTLDFIDEETAEVTFEIPQRALTPGQICGFYEGEKLLGGGVFQRIHHSSSQA